MEPRAETLQMSNLRLLFSGRPFDARGKYFAKYFVSDSLKWRSFPVNTCHPDLVRVKLHLSILPAASQCQSRRGCWNLIVNRPLRRPLKQVKPFGFTASRKLTLTTAAHHSHYRADDLNVFVLNELLPLSTLFSDFPAAFVATMQIFAYQNPGFNPKDMSNTSFQSLWLWLQIPSPSISLRSA